MLYGSDGQLLVLVNGGLVRWISHWFTSQSKPPLPLKSNDSKRRRSDVTDVRFISVSRRLSERAMGRRRSLRGTVRTTAESWRTAHSGGELVEGTGSWHWRYFTSRSGALGRPAFRSIRSIIVRHRGSVTRVVKCDDTKPAQTSTDQSVNQSMNL